MNLAGTAFDHALGSRARGQEGAAQMGVHDPVPSLLGEVLQRAAKVDAGIVDQNVNRPNPALDIGDTGVDRRRVADIEHDSLRLESLFIEAFQGRLDPSAIEIVDRHVRAGPGKSAGESQADPPRP